MAGREGPPAVARRAAGPRQRDRPIDRLLTALPSCRSSPRLRPVPQSGASREIVALRRGRPLWEYDIPRPKSRQPSPRQPITVSGVANTICRCQAGPSPRARTHCSLSYLRTLHGREAEGDRQLVPREALPEEILPITGLAAVEIDPEPLHLTRAPRRAGRSLV